MFGRLCLCADSAPRVKANGHLLQPPVNNYCVYHPSSSGGYTVMIVGGPNARTDFHVNPTPEFFYQYRGSMLLRTISSADSAGPDQPAEAGGIRDIPIHEGSLFLLPANTPHCPVRFADSIGVVVEMPRPDGATDALRWYCRSCGALVTEQRFVCSDLGTQVKAVVEQVAADRGRRTCARCGAVVPMAFGDGEVVQP